MAGEEYREPRWRGVRNSSTEMSRELVCRLLSVASVWQCYHETAVKLTGLATHCESIMIHSECVILTASCPHKTLVNTASPTATQQTILYFFFLHWVSLSIG